MRKKGILISTAVSMLLYFTLPGDLGRLDMLCIIIATFVGVWAASLPIEDLKRKRKETNDAFERMRNERPASVLTGSSGWKMVEISAEELLAK